MTLKTHDTATGVTLKYQTNKAQEVGRLMAACAKLGREMARLPELTEDVIMKDDVEAAPASGVATPVPAAASAPAQGGKKKKKGKK